MLEGVVRAAEGPVAESGSAQEVVLRFPPQRSVHVRVVSAETGEPIAGATVRAFTLDRHGHSDLPQVWTTGADGWARVEPLTTADLAFGASAPGHVEVEPGRGHPPVVAAADVAPEVEVRLRRGGVLAGRVRIAGGEPRQALVTIDTTGFPDDAADIVHETVTTHGDGTFRVDTLPPGDYRVVALVPLSVTLCDATIEVATDVEDLDLVVPPPYTSERTGAKWTLVVLDSSGAPVDGARVQLRQKSWVGSGRPAGRGEEQFDRWEQPTETWIEVHSATDFAGQPLGPVLVRLPDLAPDRFEVRLPPQRTIRGRLVDEQNRPVRGVTVSAWPTHRPFDRGDRNEHDPHGADRSDADGVFEVPRLGEGEYDVVADVPDEYVPTDGERAAAGAEGIVVRLRSAAHVIVTVLDADGAPVAGCSVTTGRDGARGPFPSGRTASHGQTRLGHLDPLLRYRLSVGPPEARDDLLPHRDDAWAPASTQIRLERGYVIEGVVQDEHGRPVPRAMVQTQTGPAGWSGEYADAFGRFKIRNLRAGETRRIRAAPTLDDPNPPMRAPPVHGSPEPDTFLEFVAGTRDVVLVLRRE